jgi:tetratricopeptide (TPR) repeat protein
MPDRVEAFPGPVFEPTQEPQRAYDLPVAPMARSDAFFESELETTMKRPAVRLQAMKQSQQSVPPTPYQYQSGRSKQPTSIPVSGGGRDGSQRLQERLVQGYQHQLVGDYDEAMQEYRIIIKSAPELLDEVVSNVRALLKLAPKYSAGYRVLGDAYMRQGEYLQAMEAYNKALTMAKKAKA